MVHKSIVNELTNVPEGNAVGALLQRESFTDRSDSDVYIDTVTGRSLTFAQYARLVPRAAALFRNKYGVKQNQVVGLFGINHLYTAAIHHGVLSLGAVLTPANIMYNPEELAHQFRMTQPSLVIVYDPLVKTTEEATKLAKLSIKVLTFTDLFKEFDALVTASTAPEVMPVPVDGKKAHAYYCCSSGTSGLPKVVVTTHYNMIANIAQVDQSRSPYNPPEYTQSCVLPMSHIFGLNTGVWSGAYSGKTTVIFPKFDIEQFVSNVCKYNVKMLYVVPPIVLALGKLDILDRYPKFKDTVSLIISGAAPISGDTIKRLNVKCPNTLVVQGYGLTETTPVAHVSTVEGFDTYDPSTIGWLVPGTEALLVDPETGKEVTGYNKPGELWLRGAQVMAGYLNNEKATKDSMTPDGWFKTGDVAVVHEDESFSIVDRIKELIKSNGHQVAPAELESILLTHPKVSDAAVIGVYNEDKTSENPRAYLALAPGTDAREIVTWFNKRVAKHKRLWGGAVVLPQIPKSASGKILRKDLRASAPTDKNVVYAEKAAL